LLARSSPQQVRKHVTASAAARRPAGERRAAKESTSHRARDLWRSGFEELFFAEDHGIDVVGGELESVTVGDRVRGAGFDAVSTKNAAGIIDVVDAGVAFGGGDAIGFGIFGGFDIDAARGASCGTKKASDALLESILVALQNVDAAIARLKVHRFVGIIFGGRLSPKIAKGDAEALGQSRDRAADFLDDCHIV
jgi:hypothetical protein